MLVVQRTQTTPFCTWPPRSPDLTVCDFFLWSFVKDNVYVPPLQERASTLQWGTSHKTCLRGFGGNGSIAWTCAVSHDGRTWNAFKVTMKLQTFLFQMVVTSCVSKSNKNQLDATLCSFYFCRVTLHVSGASAHHQKYLKLVQRPLVRVFCKIYNIINMLTWMSVLLWFICMVFIYNTTFWKQMQHFTYIFAGKSSHLLIWAGTECL